MSNDLLNRAWDTKVATVAMKLVLVSLADQANSDSMCWPGYGFISKRTGLHRNTVIKSIQKLEKTGFLTKAHREGNGCSKSNMYTLHLDGSSTAQLPSNSKPLPSNAELPPQSHRITRGGSAELPKPLYNHQLEPSKNQYRSNDFDRWWSAYPKKVGKKPTLTIWKRIKPDADMLIADIENRLANDSKAYGPWEKCPYTGRMRRLKPGYELLAARLGDGIADKRTPDEIRDDIESMLAMPDPYADMRT
jgi:hypothetical protein